jgi:hypothetical protein
MTDTGWFFAAYGTNFNMDSAAAQVINRLDDGCLFMLPALKLMSRLFKFVLLPLSSSNPQKGIKAEP